MGDSLLAKIVYATKQSVAQTTAEIDYQMRRGFRVHCGTGAARRQGKVECEEGRQSNKHKIHIEQQFLLIENLSEFACCCCCCCCSALFFVVFLCDCSSVRLVWSLLCVCGQGEGSKGECIRYCILPALVAGKQG